MKKCKNCGTVISDDSIMVCPNCNTVGQWLIGKPKARSNNDNASSQMQMNNNQQSQAGFNGTQQYQQPVQNNLPLTKKEIKAKKKEQQMQSQQMQSQQMQSQNMYNNQQTGVNRIKETSEVISVFEWLKLMVLMAIPIVNIVIIIMTLTNKSANKTKKNYIIAALIVSVISFILALVASMLITSMITNAVMSMY